MPKENLTSSNSNNSWKGTRQSIAFSNSENVPTVSQETMRVMIPSISQEAWTTIFWLYYIPQEKIIVLKRYNYKNLD